MKYLLASLIAVGLMGGMVTANIAEKISKHKNGSSNLGDTNCYTSDYSLCPKSYTLTEPPLKGETVNCYMSENICYKYENTTQDCTHYYTDSPTDTHSVKEKSKDDCVMYSCFCSFY